MNIKTKWVIGTSAFTIATIGLLGLQACSSDPDSTTPVDNTAGTGSSIAGAPSAGASDSSAGTSNATAGTGGSSTDDTSTAGSTTGGVGGDTSGGAGGTGGVSGDTSGGAGGTSGASGSGGSGTTATTFTIQTSGTLGQVLATASGLTLYVFGSDTASTTAPVSACSGGCLTTWPIYDGDPATVPASLSATDFSTFSNGGSTQSTYQGWPLYTYSGDTATGQTNGDGVGTWHAVKIPFTAP